MMDLQLTSPLRDRGFHRVRLEIAKVEVVVREDSQERRFPARIFTPVTVNEGKSFRDYLQDWPVEMHRLADRQDAGYFKQLQLILCLEQLLLELDPRRRREFALSSLDFEPTFVELAKVTRTRRLPKLQRLLHFAGETTAPSRSLVRQGLYERPELFFARGLTAGLDLCEGLLFDAERLLDAMGAGWLNTLGERGLAERARTGQGGTVGEVLAEARRTAENFGEVYMKVLTKTLEAAMEDESSVARHFALAVQAARGLLSDASELETARARQILESTVAELRSLLDQKVRDRIRPKGAGSLPYREMVGYKPNIIFAHIRYLRRILRENSATATREALQWITTELGNRTDELRLLCRKAEEIRHRIAQHVSWQIYRELRDQMTEPERRLFKLMYFRLPALDRHVAIMETAITSFFTGMDDETCALIVLAMGFKTDVSVDRREMLKTLDTRWRAYWRVYPTWVEIDRSDDREAKHELFAAEHEESMDVEKHDDEGKVYTLHDRLIGSNPRPTNLIQAMALVAPSDAARWIDAYCKPLQKRYLRGLILEDRTQSSLAEEAGISQQAVSQHVQAGLKRIDVGLRKDGYYDRARNRLVD